MTFLVLLSTVGPIAVMVMLLVLGELSRRLGAVLKTSPAHRWFYLAALLTAISVVVRLLSIGLPARDFNIEDGDTSLSLVYLAPLTIGVVIGLVITWRYWGWLVYASDGKTLRPRQKEHH
ncbi:MAG: hypothetical protein GYB66_06550 [Chloroflexi bacterium]|nr:hypothetical protein [Chloroflexota bacterium]